MPECSNVLILVDLYDPLGAPVEETRRQLRGKVPSLAEAAATLGCSGIRINAISDPNSPPRSKPGSWPMA